MMMNGQINYDNGSISYDHANGMCTGYQYDSISIPDSSLDNYSALSASASPASLPVQEWKPHATEEIDPNVFDSNNVFALGEAAGMT